jgi:hypothetical protein
MTFRNSAAVAPWSGLDAPTPVASWYTEGHCDEIGDRLLMFDNSGTPSLELLRFRPPFAGSDGFEDALRERVDALRAFDHRGFSQVRAVERLDSGDLVLVSTFTTGKRISEIFWSRRARPGVHPAFAAWFIRESSAAVAELHRQGAGIAHAALTPDRVILTPDGRLVIVEHVLGAALARQDLTVGQVQHLGLAAVENGAGGALLDQRTDVVQLGWIALSLLLGRRITPLDYPHRVDVLLDEFAGTSQRGSALISALRRWMERALQVSEDAFESAIHAHAELGDLRAHGGSHAIAFAASRVAVEQLAFEPPHQLPPMHATPPESPAPGFGAHQDVSESSSSETVVMAVSRGFAADVLGSETPADRSAATHADAKAALRAKAGWLAAAALAVIAAAEAVWIARAELARPVVSPAPPVPVVVDSLQEGDEVIVDGRAVGVTPLRLALTPDMRSIRVRTHSAAIDTARAEEAPVVTPRADTAASVALAQAAARERRGGLRVSSSIDVQVFEGERVLGSSTDGPIVATAGRHELDFVNSEFGYQSRQVVDIKAGQIIPLKISPPDGRVSVNAVPWAQVSIDGNPVGETPLANLTLPVGEHQIVFRHPQLGERTQKVIVKSNALTRVSSTLAR